MGPPPDERPLTPLADPREALGKDQAADGAAADRFQSSAIGKFIMIVQTQIAGSWTGDVSARITLNRTDAARLIVGHITSTVQALRTTMQPGFDSLAIPTHPLLKQKACGPGQDRTLGFYAALFLAALLLHAW